MTRGLATIAALVFGLVAGALAPAPAEAIMTHENLAPVDVGATSTTVFAGGDETVRLLILQNDSDTVMYCRTDGSDAVVGRGIRLNANGGTAYQDIAVPRGAIKCIHGGVGNKKLMPTVGR